MAKGGFKVMDSDIHVDEPHDLWDRYLEPRFKDRAPRFAAIDGSHTNGWQFEGKVFPAFFDRPERRRFGRIRREKALARHLETGRYKDPAEDLPGDDPHAMLKAMDREGIDLAIVFRTRGAHLIALDGLEPDLSAAICRAFNNWISEFCATDRARLKPTAILPLHDPKLAVEEARRSVRELGAVAVVLSNHPVNGRAWYDPAYEPLWAEAERLGVPVAFHGIQMAYQEHLGRRFMDNFVMAHAVAHPLEQMMALGSLLTGGVFERYPHLKAAFLEVAAAGCRGGSGHSTSGWRSSATTSASTSPCARASTSSATAGSRSIPTRTWCVTHCRRWATTTSSSRRTGPTTTRPIRARSRRSSASRA